MKIYPQKDKILSISKDSLFILTLTFIKDAQQLDLTDTEIKQILDLINGQTISKRSLTILKNKNFITNDLPLKQFYTLYEKLNGEVIIELKYNVE